ncbi:MAG: GAF domain-containing protein, partial [Bacteroidales bacterium]|nr:GAF domain-containing protein [Bacteroidales bacterium]
MKTALLFVTSLITFFSAIAQDETMSFKNLTPGMGLSHGDVLCFYQDHEGYMWIGTVDGLNKYDGVAFTVYKHNQNDTTSLSDNIVINIYEDKKNNLWVASIGLCRYNREKDNFERITYKDDQNKKIENIVTFLFEDNDNKLWVSTSNGVYWFDTEKRIFHQCFTDTYGKDILVNFSEIHQDKNGILWFISEDKVNGGIIKYNPVTKETDRFHTQHPIFKLKENAVYSLIIDKQENIWTGAYSTGLSMINQRTKTITNYQKEPGNNNSLSNNFVQSLAQNREGKIFIGTNGGGLNIFDPVTKLFEHYTATDTEGSILSTSIKKIYIGHDGMIWIGCWAGGVSIYDKRFNKFTQYKQDKQTGYLFNAVTSFAEDLNGNIWIATDGRGITWFNPKEKKFVRHLSDINNHQTLTNNKVLAVETDNKGGLWVGMWQGGLNYFQINGSQLILKKKYPYVDETDPKSNSIFRIYRNSAGEIWVGNFETGAYLFDPKTERFKPMFSLKDITREIKAGSAIVDIISDYQGDVWFATLGTGLIRLNRKTGKCERFTHHEKDSTSISSDGINVVFEDSEKRLWVGSSGLSLFNRDNNTFTHYSTAQGLPDNTIVGILEDNHHNLWISTHNGISKATIVTTKEKTELSCRNYSDQDGLQDKVFNKWAFYKSKSGEMYFGGISGFNVFHPDSIKDNPYIPPVHITDFLLFNKPVIIGAKNSPLKKHISQTQELLLKHNQSVLTFSFIALNYIFSEKNQYAYRMEGFEKNWNYVGNKREATYTNLDPGEYTFRVKASNNDGIWNEKGTSVKIIILPPWWQTWWFRILAIFVILYSVISYFNYRTRRLRMQKIVLTKMVRERTLQLEEANSTLEKNQEEISLQNEELQLARTELEQRVKERTAELIQSNTRLKEEIDERKQAEESLRSLNRELHAISNCNQTLLRAEDEQTLLNEICRIICDDAGYRMAWVGYAEHDDAKTVRPVAWAGFDDGYVISAKLSWADDAERAQGPGGTAIRSGKTVYIEDFTTDPRMAPWRESALQRGYRSTIALPLKDENVFGVLLIYSTEINSFTLDEIRLLEELAGDLAFGIGVLHTRTERKRAEKVQTAIYRISESTQTAPSLDELFMSIHKIIAELMPARNFYIALYNAATETIHFPYFIDERDITPSPYKLSNGLTDYVLRTGKTLFLTQQVYEQHTQSGQLEIIGTHPIDWLGVPLKSQQGKTIGVMAVQTYTEDVRLSATDQSILEFVSTQVAMAIERKRAEEELKVLSHAVEQSPAMIIITDTEGIIEYINPEFTDVTGYSMEEVIGKKPNILKSGKMPEVLYKDLWDTIKSNKIWYGEMINKTKDGKNYWVNISISPIIDNDGNVFHFVGLAEDITAKKKTEEDLIIAKEHAEESDRLKTAFLQNMSHEIRTPMNAIVGFSTLLTNPGTTSAEAATFTSIIIKSSEELLMLIDDILDMSQIQANQLIILKKPVDVIEIMKELFTSFQLQVRHKGIELILEAGTLGENIFCSADPFRFKQVLSNLISNALKFTEKGFVKLGVTLQNQGFITFYVQDSGIGIPKEVGNSIFERFLKVETPITKLYRGVGLGLAICYNLVKAMGGNIWYESILGQGTTFYFTIPCNDIEYIAEPETKNKQGRHEIPDLSDKQILIVEDEESNYLLLEFFLAKTNARLIWAKDGLDALENVKINSSIDLVLMDLKMPVMDGIEATKLIRQIKPDLLIVAQTAFAYKEEKVEFSKCGFNGY